MMKRIILIFGISLIISMLQAQVANVGIGTSTPDASALLDLTSSDKGLLIPRVQLLSATDQTTIASPATGLLVYNRAGALALGFYYWDGARWVRLDGNGGGHPDCISLQAAYDCPESGQGRAINAADGAVEISSPATAANTTALKVNSNNNASPAFNGERSSVGGSALDAYYHGTGNGVAVWAEADNSSSRSVAAVVGVNKSNTVNTCGLKGRGNAGVMGEGNQGLVGYGTTGSNPQGVYAENRTSSSGFGVKAKTRAGVGVSGLCNDPDFSGLQGQNDCPTQGYGIVGGGFSGVRGQTINADGEGISGVNANHNGGNGVYGTGFNGVYGITNIAEGSGVVGLNQGEPTELGLPTGVEGHGYVGVCGQASYTDGWGVYAAGHDEYGSGGNMGCDGNLVCGGPMSAPVKNFLIPHPTEAGKVLKHTCIESPMPTNMYSGNVVLDRRGEAVVELPTYFTAINVNFRYQLTPVGESADLYVKDEIKDNRFVVAGGKSGLKVSWTVYADRNDEYVRTHPEARMDVLDRRDTQLGAQFTDFERIRKSGLAGKRNSQQHRSGESQIQTLVKLKN